MEMGVLVHPQLGLLCGAALPGCFFLKKQHLKRQVLSWFLNDVSLKWSWLVINSSNHYQNRHPDPFGGYPKSLKWSSQSRPMIELVRKSRQKNVPSTITIPESGDQYEKLDSRASGLRMKSLSNPKDERVNNDACLPVVIYSLDFAAHAEYWRRPWLSENRWLLL